METFLRVADVVGRLVGPLAQLVDGLMKAGQSPEEAEADVRRDLESRLARVNANRAKRDAEFARKHGEPLKPADE